MPVRATKGTLPTLDRWFDCAQWDAMPVDKNGWAVVVVDCVGELPWSRRPWAEAVKYPPTSFSGSGNVTIEGDAPIFVSNNNGIVQISVQSSDVLAGSSKVTVTNGGNAILGQDDVSVDVVEANLSLQNIGGLLTLVQINPAGSSAGQVITNVGGVPTWATPVAGYTDEMAQDAVGNFLADTNTVDMVYDDATPTFSANVRMQMSITSDASGVKLSGDVASPGNSFYYGTNGSGTKGYFALPVGASKWTDGTGGSIYRNSNVAIGNAPTPTARLTVDGGTALYPLLAYTANNVAAWNIFANTDTTRATGIALSELITGADLAFIINRYGSTHATTANKVELMNQKNASLVLGTNNNERIIIAAGGSVTVPNIGGTGTRLVQADSSGTLARSTIDPATLVAYTFENGLTNTTGVVRWGGTLTQATTITQATFAVRFTGNYFGIHKTANNPTSRATFTVDGLAVIPSTVAGPSEDAVANFHGTSAGTQIDAQLSIGAYPVAADGVWIAGRSITGYTTPRVIKFQPRGGKEVHGANTAYDPQFTFAGSALTSTVGALTSVTLHVCNTGESLTRPKISLGTNNTFLAGISHDSANIATRFFCMSSSGSVRFGVGGEDTDKVVIMNGGAGRLGAGFATTTGLHSTLQSSGSMAAAILSSVAAPTLDEAKHTLIYTAATPVTYTLPTSSTCVGRIYIITNHGTSTVTISPAVSRGGATFNTLTQGQWAWMQAQASGWVGFKLTSL